MKSSTIRIFISLVFFCTTTMLVAQNTVLEGIVSDSLGVPIELANVMAFYKSDSTVASFGITNSEGEYRLILPKEKKYTLKASFIGYTTWESELFAQGDKMHENLVLKESSKLLDEVEIKYEFPITVSGDTVIYKTDEFTTGKERKLGNVLEALPGFEIDENGDIKVQGKKVDKVLVEGKKFFDGNSKMVTRNIPASAVDKVQLLQNYNDVSPMSGFGDDERLAINITLKEGEENMWFGDVEAGAGPKERYLAHPNLFYYSPKTNVNFIADANNIGEQAFTMSDYFRFSGGMRKIGRKSGVTFNMSSDEFGMSLMQNNRAKNVDSNLGALNINHQPNKKWNFTAYGIMSSNKTALQTTSNRSYIRQQSQNNEETTSEVLQENVSGLFKLSGAYTPNANTHIEYESFIKASNIAQNDSRTSDFGALVNLFNESDTKSPFSIDNTLVSYFTLNKKNVLSAEVNWNYKRQVPQYNLFTNVQPFQSVIPLTAAENYRLIQSKEIITNTVQAELNHYYIINKTNHINFGLGTNSSFQHYISGMEQQDAVGNNLAIGDDFTNNVQFAFTDYYASIYYKTKLGKLTLSPGISGHLFKMKDEQNSTANVFSKTLLTPNLYAKYSFGSTENLTLNYGLNTEFTDVQNMALGGVIRNYNTYYIGNNELENAAYHDVSLSYFNFNMFNHTNIFGMLNYQKKYNSINESIAYLNTDRVSSPDNIEFWNDMLFGNFSFEKKYVGVRLKAGANVSYMQFQNEVEGELNTNESFNQEYRFSVESKFYNAPNFEVGMKQGWNIYNSNAIQQEYYTSTPYVDVEVGFLKYFTLVADYEFNNYKSKDGTTQSNYDFLNATLYFRKTDSPWEFKVSGKNLLSTTTIRRDSFSDNIVSTYAYYVQPRYFLLTVKYDL